MRHTIKNDLVTFTSDSFQVEPWELRFLDDRVNYFWRPPEVEKLGAAICFPLLGTLPEDRYRLDDRTYTMETHGFAKNMEFRVAELQDDRIVYELTDSEETLRQYPYPFRLRVVYALEGASLRTEYRVENPGTEELFFSVGGHPRYACPVGEGRFEDWFIEFEQPESPANIVKSYGPVEVIERFFSGDGRQLSLDYAMFAEGCFCLHPVHSAYVTLKSRSGGRSLRLSTDALTHLQLWTSVGGPFLCMEPWFGSISHLPFREPDGDWKGRPGTLRILPGEESVSAYTAAIAK